MISIVEALRPIVSRGVNYPKPPHLRQLNRAVPRPVNQSLIDEKKPYTNVLGGPGIVGGGDYRAIGTSTPLFKRAG